MQELIKFGGGPITSSVHPFAIFALIITITLILLLPRKYIVVAVLTFVLLIPQAQQFYIAGVHFYIFRIVVLFGFLRLVRFSSHNQQQFLPGGSTKIDRFFFLYVLTQAIAFSLQHMNLNAVINQFGFIWDTLGGYCLMRFLIIDHQDIDRALKCTSYIFAVLAVTMIIEQIYRINPFGYIGGQMTPDIRENSVRSYGSFRHPITAGNTAATMAPLFLLLGYRSRQWFSAGLGLATATIMIVAVHSSGPLIAYAAGIMALLLWPLRKSMHAVRWLAVFSLLILQLLMKAPVWFLIARIDLTGGSSSYHRANLIDKFVRHFWEWWLIGSPNNYTWGWDLWDVQNQYVSIGLQGGLGALMCFIAMILAGFSMIGNARKHLRSQTHERCLWVIGSTLFSYVVAFLGVNLFDQSRVLWFMLLAAICAYVSPHSSLETSTYKCSHER